MIHEFSHTKHAWDTAVFLYSLVMSPSPTSDHDDMPYVYLLAHPKLLQKDALSGD